MLLLLLLLLLLPTLVLFLARPRQTGGMEGWRVVALDVATGWHRTMLPSARRVHMYSTGGIIPRSYRLSLQGPPSSWFLSFWKSWVLQVAATEAVGGEERVESLLLFDDRLATHEVEAEEGAPIERQHRKGISVDARRRARSHCRMILPPSLFLSVRCSFTLVSVG